MKDERTQPEMLDGYPIYDAVMQKDKFHHGTNTISLVGRPATQQPVFYFDEHSEVKGLEEEIEFRFASEEKGLITGVLMLADTPIKRVINNKTFWLRFPASVVEEMVFKFMKNQFGRNVNKEHDPNQPLHGVYLVEIYIYDPARGRQLDSIFDEKVVTPGSAIVTMKVEDEKIRQEIKEKKIVGYSLEGDFGIKVNFEENFASIQKSFILDANNSVEDKFEHIKNAVENAKD